MTIDIRPKSLIFKGGLAAFTLGTIGFISNINPRPENSTTMLLSLVLLCGGFITAFTIACIGDWKPRRKGAGTSVGYAPPPQQ